MKQVRVCLGRFQPFTLGHLKMATYKCRGPETIQGFKGEVNQKELLREQPDISEINKQKTLILVVKVDDNEVDKRHPFPYSLMKDEMDLVKKYPEIEDVMFVDSADICKWGEMIKHAGYQASVWLTGSDEAKHYVEMAMKVPEYEEHNRDNRDCKDAYTKSFYVESIERDDSSTDFSATISGTKVRESINNDDIDLFKKMMPKGCDKLFDKFKEALSNPNLPDVYKKPKKKKVVKESKLQNYIYNNTIEHINTDEIKESLLDIYEFYFLNNDYDTWLNETIYESNLDEDNFYNNKWNFSGYNMDKPDYSIWKTLLYEKLKDSLEINEKDIDRIKSINGIDDVKVENNKRLCFTITFNEDLDEKSFIELLNFYGYTINNIEGNIIRCESRIPKELSYKDIDHVYHVTNKSCYEKIKKYGLYPKRKEKYDDYYIESGKTILEYPERIYCWLPDTSKETIKHFASISKLTTQNKSIDNDTVLLKINIGELNKNRDNQNKISFYTDPAYNTNKAVFTMEPIKSKFIEQIDFDDIQQNKLFIKEHHNIKHYNFKTFIEMHK